MNVLIDDFDSFKYIKDFPVEGINDAVLKTVVNLNEKTQLEPFLRGCIFDVNDTPHGPMEIVDILTTKIKCRNRAMYGAFILKGKSFKRITAQDISHQIFRLKKIGGLEIAILGYTGNLLDQPHDEFITTCIEIGCDYSIWNNYDFARLFISEGFICPRDGKILGGNVCDCGYTFNRETLNIYQEEAIKRLSEAHQLEQTKGLVILPTGAGKTRVSVKDVKANGYKRVLYVAHTHEILEGAHTEYNIEFDDSDLNFLTTSDKNFKLQKVNFITIQLLNNTYLNFKRDDFDYIIIDEFHHAVAKSYRTIINHFNYKFLLGLTATPFRQDQIDILALCDGNIVVNYELRDGIEAGILSPYHYYGLFDTVDYTKIRHKGEQYDINDLEKALVLAERNESIIKIWKEKALNKPSIGFCCSQLHASRCYESFTQNGISSALYISSTGTERRKKIIDEFKNGIVKVIFTVDVFNEGVDFPFVECLLFLRPTESKRIFLQQLGRGLRRFHGKSNAIVLDFIGNFINAFKIVEYFGLTSNINDDYTGILTPKTFKEIYNLPLGCEIFFDEQVINIFSLQYLDKRNITRHNIHRIIIQQFVNLCLRLKRIPSWREIDRFCPIKSTIYKMFFYKRTSQIAKQVEDILLKNGITIGNY
jgi:superfamily II DNA or RNA helicase